MSKVCMAAVNENDKTFSTKRLQERFPEIPETVIAKILTQHAYNMEKCITILTQESDRYLYGESSDGPVVTLPQSTLEPLSIQIPPQPTSDLATNYYVRDSPRTPRDRATTVGIASSGGATAVPGTQGDRHHQVDEYSRKLIPHQQQRLERLIKEVELEKQKLFELQSLVSIKQEEIMNKNFRVAGNPSKTDVDHLEEETQVLREEIDQMSHEIDSIKCSNYKVPPPMKKSQSFPRPCPSQWINDLPQPVNDPHGPRPTWVPPQGSQSPVRDPSLEGQGWVFLPQSQLPSVPPPDPPSRAPDDTEQTWVCQRCTLENHGALNTCEACEYPRT